MVLGLGGVQAWVGGKDILMRMDPLPSVDKTSLHGLAGSTSPRGPSIERLYLNPTPQARLGLN